MDANPQPQGLRASEPHEVQDQELKAEFNMDQVGPAIEQLKTLAELLEPILKGRTLNQRRLQALTLRADLFSSTYALPRHQQHAIPCGPSCCLLIT
jgi:hypothetical protein